jgi:beta-lactamase class A
MAALFLLGLIGGGIWAAFQVVPQVLAQGIEAWPNLPDKVPSFFEDAQDTRQFETFLDRDFGLLKIPSLLYYPNLDYALLTHREDGLFQNKLRPIMPVAEDHTLKSQLEAIIAEFPADRFRPHLYFYNPQDRTYVEINGYDPVPAASVIKLPILLDYLMNVDKNLITIDTPLLYAEHHRASGSGSLQYQDSGKAFTANDVAQQMIRTSDNTCTNMMISYLGGTEAINKKLANLGLVHTRIRNWLPDLSGTNTISSYEMVSVLYNIDSGPLVSELSRINGTQILESTHNRHLLVWSLPREARVAHKTGDIGTSLGDSGTVYLPDGRKYFLSMQVERPYNDYSVRDLFHRASRAIYDHVSAQPTPQNPLLQTIDPNQLTQNTEPSKAL